MPFSIDWCLYERERLQYLYLTLLDKLIDYCEAHHQYEKGITYGLTALRYDRARERTHLRLMRLQSLTGNRTAALRQYEGCVAALQEELGVKPAQRTVALYEQIRADQFNGQTLGPTGAHPTASLLLPEILDQLQQLQALLTEAQHQVQQNVETVKSAIDNQR